MKVRLAIALAIAGCTHTSPPPVPHRTEPAREMPLSLFAGRWGVVDVDVAGRPVRFVVDTGANRTLVDLALAREHGWPVSECRQIPGALVGELCRVTIDDIEVAGRRFSLTGAYASPLASSELGEALEVSGLLGGDVLSQFALVIDYPRARWALVPPSELEPPNGARIEVEIREGAVFVPVRLGDADATFLLDTGNGGRTIVLDVDGQETFAAAAGEGLLLPGVIRSGAGGSADATPCRGPLTVGPFTMQQAPLYVARRESREGTVMATMDGILGVGFLEHFRMTLDYANHALYLEQVLPFPDAQHDATFGFTARPSGGELVVQSVASAGPAALADVRGGDVVVSIDGVPVGANAAVLWPRTQPVTAGSIGRFSVRRGDGDVREISLTAIAIP